MKSSKVDCISVPYHWSTLNLQAHKLGGYRSGKHRFVYEFHVVDAAALLLSLCVCSNQHGLLMDQMRQWPCVRFPVLDPLGGGVCWVLAAEAFWPICVIDDDPPGR